MRNRHHLKEAKVMKKTFRAPTLVDEPTLAELTLGPVVSDVVPG